MFSVHGKVLPVVPHPCPWGCHGAAPSGCVGNGQSCCLQLRSEAAAGQCQPRSILFLQPGRDGASGAAPSPGWPVATRAHLTRLLPPELARGTGQEGLTRLQMEESGLREELAAHPDRDKSERCQSHLQWKTTKWLVGRQLVDEGAGNCSSLLSPPPCIETCSALLPSALPGTAVSTRAGLFHRLHLAFSAYLVL